MSSLDRSRRPSLPRSPIWSRRANITRPGFPTMANASIDINCDIGEEGREEPCVTPSEEALLGAVTSVNIACGFHAGDPGTMAALTRAAAERGIAIGAHPSLPDREGFGRREMAMAADQVHQVVLYQVGALAAFAKAAGSRLNHVKPHGALYHMAEKDEEIAQAIVRAVQAFDPGVIVVGLSGGKLVQTARQSGLAAADEVFADRAYRADATLAPRGTSGAVIIDADRAAERILRLLQTGEIVAEDGAT